MANRPPASLITDSDPPVGADQGPCPVSTSPLLDRPIVAWPLLLLLLTVAGIARFATLHDWPLWSDEVFTWITSTHLGPIHFLDWTHHYEHSPLSYILVRACIIALGSESEFVLRLPSFVAGMLCLPAFFVLGRVLHSYRLGLALSLLAAFDPVLLLQARQARMYSLLALMTVLVLIAMVVLYRRRQTSPWLWLGFGLLVAATYWSHALGLVLWGVLIVATLLWLLLSRHDPDNSEQRWHITKGVCMAMAVAAMVSHVGLARLGSRIKHADPDSANPQSLLNAAFEVIHALNQAFVWLGLGIGLLLLGTYGLIRLVSVNKPIGIFSILLAAAGLIAVVLARLEHHSTEPYYLILMLLVMIIGVGCAAVLPGPRAMRFGAWGFILMLSAVQAYAAFDFSMQTRFRQGGIVRLANELSEPDDAIYYFSPAFRHMGEYYDATANPTLPELVDYRYIDYLPHDELLNPEAERAWVIVGEVRPHWQPYLIKLVDALANVHDVSFDADELINTLTEVQTMLLRIDADGVTILED